MYFPECFLLQQGPPPHCPKQADNPEMFPPRGGTQLLAGRSYYINILTPISLSGMILRLVFELPKFLCGKKRSYCLEWFLSINCFMVSISFKVFLHILSPCLSWDPFRSRAQYKHQTYMIYFGGIREHWWGNREVIRGRNQSIPMCITKLATIQSA